MITEPYFFNEQVVVRIPTLEEELLKDCVCEESILNKFSLIETALYLSSKDLFHTIKRYSSLDASKKEKAIESLYKYLIRVCTRPTPYGFFAGTFTSAWGATSGSLIADQKFQHNISIDYRILFSLYKQLAADSGQDCRYYLNNTIANFPDKISMYKFDDSNTLRRDYIVSEYAFNEPLKYISDYLSNDLKKRGEIVKYLHLNGADPDDAATYVTDLIKAKILLPEYEICFNNTDYFNFLSGQFAENSSSKKSVSSIQQVVTKLSKINNGTADLKSFIDIENHLKELLNSDSYKNFFKVDLIGLKQNHKVKIPSTYQSTILQGLDVYCKLKLFKKNNKLADFQQKFISRYQYQSVPLLEALDPHRGIVYLDDLSIQDDPLLNDVPFFKTNLSSSPYPHSSMLYQKLTQAERSGDTKIILKENDISHLESDYTDLAETIHVMFRVLDTTAQTIYIDAIGGGALNVVTRFKYGDASLQKLHDDVVAFEDDVAEKKQQIVAEITHVPNRVEACNLLDNANLRKYTIPIVYPAGGKSQNLLLEDLLVSVRYNKIVLYSKSLNSEVIPRLSSMILPSSISDLPIYRFLVDVAQSHQQNLVFSWNYINGTERFKFLPRLQYKNVIICPSIWRIEKEETTDIIVSDYSSSAIEAFKKKHKLPDKIVLKEHDNELLIDMKNNLSVKLLVSEVNKLGALQVGEYIYSSNSLINNTFNKPVNSQLIAFLHKSHVLLENEIANKKDVTMFPEDSLTVVRKFFPGDQWMYYKLYCTEIETDILLTEFLTDIVQELLEKRVITGWFYIRFYDAEPHLRVRFLLNENADYSNVFNFLNNIFKNNKMIRKSTLDTYEREIERYGKDFIVFSEQLFYYDSQFALEFLKVSNQFQDKNFQWIFVMRTIDSFLNMFSYDLDSKILLMTDLIEEFNSEFNANKNIFTTINNKYRNYKTTIIKLLDKQEGLEFIEMEKILKNKYIKSQPVAVKILEVKKDIDTLIKSHIHMALNRYYNSEQRKHEMIIYNLLGMYYSTVKAIKKKAEQNVQPLNDLPS